VREVRTHHHQTKGLCMSRNNGIAVTFECCNPYNSEYEYRCSFREPSEESGCKFAHNDSSGTHCENKQCISDAIKEYAIEI